MPVTVIARLQLKAGREAEADAALAELIDATHAEAGCLAYALHHDPTDARARVLIERWTSQVALDNHLQQPHMAAFVARGEELLDGDPDITVLEPVLAGDPVKGSL